MRINLDRTLVDIIKMLRSKFVKSILYIEQDSSFLNGLLYGSKISSLMKVTSLINMIINVK